MDCCKTRNYHQKLNVRVASRIAEHFRNDDRRKRGTFKAVYFDLMILELVDLKFELVTRRFELVNFGFELAICGF